MDSWIQGFLKSNVFLKSKSQFFLLAFIMLMLILNLWLLLSNSKRSAEDLEIEKINKVRTAAAESQNPPPITAVENKDAKDQINPEKIEKIEDPFDEYKGTENPEMMPNRTSQLSMNQKLKEKGLVDLKEYIPGIKIDLKYATKDNFMERVLYKDLDKAFLQPEVAAKLKNAQKELKKIQPEYSLLIFDACRPRSIQREMWDKVAGTEFQRYVASPNAGSLHNFGCAVDLSIVDEFDKELDMGTGFDFFGPESQPRYEKDLFNKGVLNTEQIDNRKLLRTVMKKAGFIPIQSEWWHYNGFYKEEVRRRFEIVE